MQYSTLFLAAALAATAHAYPGPHNARHHHHHHRRSPVANPEPGFDTSGVDWNKALANVDWSKVNYGGAALEAQPVQQGLTTTVAVVGSESPAANPVAAGNVAGARVAFVTTTVVAAAAQAQTPATTAPVLPAAPLLTTPATTPLAAAQTTTTPVAAAASTPESGVQMAASSSDYSIQVVNNCPYQVWQAGWQTNMAGGAMNPQVKGNAMAAGSSISLAVPKNALGVQIWARTGCTGEGSSFHCEVGDCQGFQCSSIIWQKGPIMAEFGAGLNTDMYNTDITAYDISAIPGNNVGIKIVPSISSCETKYCPVSGCDNTQAWHLDSDMSLGSPADTTCSNAANFVVTFCP